MQVINLYRYLRPNGGVTNSIEKPEGIDYSIKYRLIAEDGKLLTNGSDSTECIDVDSTDGWFEIDKPKPESESE